MRRLALALAATVALAGPAAAASSCMPFADALRYVMDRYGEAPAFIASNARGVVLTITINAKTGTWTVWGQTSSSATMCALDAGEGWEPASEGLKSVAPPGRPS